MKFIKIKNQEEAYNHLSDKQKIGLTSASDICFIEDVEDQEIHFFYVDDLECDLFKIYITDAQCEDFEIDTSEFTHLALSKSDLYIIAEKVEKICEHILKQ